MQTVHFLISLLLLGAAWPGFALFAKSYTKLLFDGEFFNQRCTGPLWIQLCRPNNYSIYGKKFGESQCLPHLYLFYLLINPIKIWSIGAACYHVQYRTCVHWLIWWNEAFRVHASYDWDLQTPTWSWTLQAQKKQTTKFTSAKILKIVLSSCIILRIKRLDDKQYTSWWGGSRWAASSGYTLFTNCVNITIGAS